MSELRETYLIIDGQYMLHRAVNAGLSIKSSLGEPTGGIYLFLKSLASVIENNKRFIVVFDRGKNEKRLEIYPDYKKKKVKEKESPLDIATREAFTYVYTHLEPLITSIGIPFIKLKGHEADDICYTLSRFLSKAYQVTVVSDDSDYIQMILHGAKIFRPKRDDTISINNVDSVFPFDLKYYTFWKALCGDVSDSITGIPGIGEKTALSIIEFFFQNGLEPGVNSLSEWATQGKTKKYKAFEDPENLKIVERNLKLIDISLLDQDEHLYISEFKKAIRGVAPNYEELLKQFRRMEINTLSFWQVYCKLCQDRI